MTQQLQDFLHHEIPLTKDMGLEFVSFDGEELTVKAPLKNNINDKGSVFGGSSSALMIMTAWSLIRLNCDNYNIKADIVIHKNETLWSKALYQDLMIKAQFKEPCDFVETQSLIGNNKHQRVECVIELQDDKSNVFSTMVAKYVIIPKSKTVKSDR